MIEINYEKDFPEEVKAIIDPLINEWKTLLPPWCQELIVKYDPTRASNMAVQVNYRTRWAVLYVPGVWLKLDPTERVAAMLHEFAHILLRPLTSPIERIIEDTLEEKTTIRELADSMYCDGEEAAVEDIAHAILRITKAHSPNQSPSSQDSSQEDPAPDPQSS